jgi:AcrR family transcriptional regulator
MTRETIRRSGRPDQEASKALVSHIVDTAARLFIEHGYSATSIERIAAAACSGKQTIYRHFVSKEGLFTEVIHRQAERLVEIAGAVETPNAEPIEALKESCRRFLEFVLNPDLVRLHRILVAEVGRFPEMGEYILNNYLEPFNALLERLFLAAMDAGQIRKADPKLMQALIRGLLMGSLMQQYLLGGEPLGAAEDRDAYFEAAWSVFLRGAGTSQMVQ